jgi:hypothetical protein
MQATRPDAIDAFFVFLYLLKRQAQGLPKLPLTHFQHHTAHSHALAYVIVDGTW